MTDAELETALAFLKSRVKATSWGTVGGLNQLPFVLFDAIAKVMCEYAELRREVEMCRECGEDYPRSDLLAGHIFCPLCRKGGSVGAPD